MVAELWPWAESRDQQVTVKGVQALPIRADAAEAGILVRNLLDNALRYTPASGRVEIELSEVDDTAVLRVRDTGPGISDDLLDTVTERFRRGTDQRTTGSGLGLSIVAELVERQGPV
nr:ATP-binding protein [Halomonas elongata]